MKNGILNYIIIILLVSITGCSSKYFVVSKDKIYSDVKVIAMSPISFPFELPNQSEKKQFFESLIKEKLESYGFKVITPDKFSKPEEMNKQYNANAILYSGVVQYQINYIGTMVAWDSVSAAAVTKGAAGLDLLNLAFGTGVRQTGFVTALSLRTVLKDINQSVLYSGPWGGLELATKGNASGGIEYMPLDQLLTNKEMIRHSVYICLNPLSEKYISSTGNDLEF